MKVRQRRANYHIRNSSESEGGCSTWNRGIKKPGDWATGRELLPVAQSPGRPQIVSRGTDDVHYISLIRTRNQQALYPLIMYKRARLFFEVLRPEDQNL